MGGGGGKVGCRHNMRVRGGGRDGGRKRGEGKVGCQSVSTTTQGGEREEKVRGRRVDGM